MKKIENYLSLIKFSHTVFALPFALLGFVMGVFYLDDRSSVNSGIEILTQYASQHPLVFIYILACMVFARSAAMAFNRYLDREFDAKNPRTAIREIPRGVISPSSALRFTIFNAILFVGAAYLINTTCFLLSPIALIVILGYSYTKRFTALCHLVLGTGLALAPAGAFIAVTENIEPSVILLSLAVTGWVSGFDIIYSLQDDRFDAEHGLYSIPSTLGRKNALKLSRILHTITVVMIFTAGYFFEFEYLYTIGAVIFTGLLLYQQSIVKSDDLSRVNIAFMTANGIASVIFAIFAITDLLILG
ncbi:MAG: UbiA-like polyprenyltransferase [bacterium]|jgi:4-hydroxybenzoate polyprenyltransferase